MKIICERITTAGGTHGACPDKAEWISPPGPWTGRVINVCSSHKRRLIDNYKYPREGFQRL